MSEEFALEHGYSQQKRAQIREAAGIIGIDEGYLSRMVEEFYARVRADTRLGPIFEAELGNDWGPHLAKMKAFWASVALSAGTYSGKPVVVHRALTGVEPDDFGRWLALFHATLADTAPEAISYLALRAERIAQSLSMAMFDRTEQGAPALN